MKVLKYIAAGAVGGVIGAVVWVLVGYFANAEVGWIAWGIGFLVGMGVRLTCELEGEEGNVSGATAAGVAIVTVIIAKYIVVVLLVNKHLPPLPLADFKPDAEVMISEEADALAEEWKAAGKTIEWPPEKDDDDAPIEKQYPKELWAEAKTRWEAKSPEEQQKAVDKFRTEVAEGVGELREALRREGFKASFSPWDLLWLGLAAYTAYRLGSGAKQE